jgi:peptide/nickel transport system substrate-binding protein
MMLPPHVLNDLTDDTMYAFDFFPPVGTGPFTVAEWVQGEYIIYDARDDYYLGKPPVDRIIYQIYANSDTMIQALLAGEVDVLMNQPAVSPVYYETLAAAEDITVLDLPPGPIHSLTFNLHSEGNKHPAIDDLVVRQAIDSAIDKEQLIDITLLGHGMTCPNGYICGPQDIYEGTINPDLKIKPYDPELSREILEEAGYTDQDGDGIREDANGLPLEFRLAFMAQDPVHLTMAESIRDWLQVIGIDVEVDATDYTTLMHVIQSERDFDMAIIGVAAETEPVSMDFYYSCWSSGSSSSWNFSGYCNPEFDELLFGMTAASSSGEYQEASFMAQEVLHRDLPVIILLGQNNLQAFRTDKFEFDTDVCQGFQGVWDPQNIMNIEVK